MAAENNRKTRLQKLSGSDFEVVDGQSDIRGWDVKDETGKQLGEVEELIFDYESRKVRYLVVDTEENDYGLDDREVLVPIGIAQLHEDDDDVILPGVTAEQLRSLPEYDENRFDTEHEVSTRNVFGGLGGAALAGTASAGASDFYNHEHFNEDNLYRNRKQRSSSDADSTIPVVQEDLNIGKQEVETSGVRLRSRVAEQEVSEDTDLRSENVRVERNNVNLSATEADFREEEISLTKNVDEREEVVRDTVRNTEVDIDDVESDHTRRSRNED